MTDNMAAFILPVFGFLQASNAPLTHFLQSGDLDNFAAVMTENIADVLQSAGFRHIYSVKTAKDILQHELFQQVEEPGIVSDSEQSLYYAVLQSESKRYEKILLINDNTIGLTPNLVKRVINNLGVEEDVTTIILDRGNACSGMAFKSYSQSFYFSCLHQDNLENFFKSCEEDRFWTNTNSVVSIKTIEDFKLLYSVLSEKNSVELCKKEYYDRFTEIFIEYKDLLK